MLKTFIYQRFIYGFPVDAVGVTMLSKLPASLLNAVAAMIAAPMETASSGFMSLQILDSVK